MVHCHHEPFKSRGWHPDLQSYNNPRDALDHISAHGLSISNYRRVVSYAQSFFGKNTGNTLVMPWKSLPENGNEGFKITWWQAVETLHSAFSSWLAEHPQLKVILLSRENTLARFVSYELAKKSGVWHAVSPPKKSVKLHIAPDQLMDFHQLQIKQKKIVNALLLQNNIDTFSVCYEHLISEPKTVMDNIFHFLGTQPSPELIQTTTKLVHQPLNEIVSNYDELEQLGLI